MKQLKLLTTSSNTSLFMKCINHNLTKVDHITICLLRSLISKIKNKESKPLQKQSGFKKLEKRLAEHMSPSCFNFIRPVFRKITKACTFLRIFKEDPNSKDSVCNSKYTVSTVQ
ncbi:CCQ_1a_G0005910.mRNA.1.CDS.1 [Saccharomyces cerevisiae]|nr:CCQ_1a_G0005910.mRNA.1.CDS.1 [Saccharomyces cerevisiae]CAI7169359.1 CCQ_1a_G0005910.mRNA.1.CDS.1 [Saccharomyces cerevisiae]